MNTAVLTSTSIQHHHADAVRLPAYSVYLDCVRAVAAFLVLAGHARMLFFGVHTKAGMIPTGLVGGTSGPTIPGLGSQAVIIFFVLSGFLVGGSAWRAVASERWSWKSYLSKRLIRLWIVLIPALVVGACLDTVGRTFLGDIYSGPAGQSMVSQELAKQSTLAVLAENAIYLQHITVPTFGTQRRPLELGERVLVLHGISFAPAYLFCPFFVETPSIRIVLSRNTYIRRKDYRRAFCGLVNGCGCGSISAKAAAEFQASGDPTVVDPVLRRNPNFTNPPVLSHPRRTDTRSQLLTAAVYAVAHASTDQELDVPAHRQHHGSFFLLFISVPSAYAGVSNGFGQQPMASLADRWTSCNECCLARCADLLLCLLLFLAV